MYSIVECLSFARHTEGPEFTRAFLACCDEGLHSEACAWIKAVVGPQVERFQIDRDYANLRERARAHLDGPGINIPIRRRRRHD